MGSNPITSTIIAPGSSLVVRNDWCWPGAMGDRWAAARSKTPVELVWHRLAFCSISSWKEGPGPLGEKGGGPQEMPIP